MIDLETYGYEVEFAAKNGDELKKIGLHPFFTILPPSHVVRDGWLCAYKNHRDEKKKVDIIEIEKICPMFWISAVANPVEGDEGGVMILKRADGAAKVFSYRDISDPRKAGCILADFLEVPFTTDTRKTVLLYLRSFFLKNLRNIRSKILAKRTGWHFFGKNKKIRYLLPSIYRRAVFWDTDRDGRLAAICLSHSNEKALYKRQIEILRKVLCTKAGLAVLAALSAPLVRPLSTSNFVLYLSGLTGSGKTTAHKFAVSLFANPEKLMGTLDTTQVGNERLANMFQDFLLWIDELETIKSQQIHYFVNLIYSYTQGKGRTRSDKNLSVRETAQYSGVMLASGERDLDTVMNEVTRFRSQPLGLRRRVLEVQAGDDFWRDLQTGRKLNLSEINRFSSRNYGAVGKKYIQVLSRLCRDKECLEGIKKEYQKITEQQDWDCRGLEQFIGLMLIALRILRFVTKDQTIGEALETYIKEKLIKKIKEEIEQTINIYVSFWDSLRAWLFANARFTEGLKAADSRETSVWAVWEQDSEGKDKIWISSLKLREFCQLQGFVVQQIVQEAERQGCLLSNRQRSGKKGYVKKIAGRAVSGYCFLSPPEEEEIEETEAEKQAAEARAEETAAEAEIEAGTEAEAEVEEAGAGIEFNLDNDPGKMLELLLC